MRVGAAAASTDAVRPDCARTVLDADRLRAAGADKVAARVPRSAAASISAFVERRKVELAQFNQRRQERDR